MSPTYFDPAMFPHTVTADPTSWTPGETGGEVRSDGTGVSLPANVILRRDEQYGTTDGDAAGSRTMYGVSVPANLTAPQLAAVLALTVESTIRWGAIVLICEAPAAPVMHGAAYRVRCRSTT